MKISTNILRCVNNDRFVSRKDDEFYQLDYGTKRIWLSDKLGIVPDKNNIYELITKNERKIEGHILACGEDELGYYIVFRMLLWRLAGKELSLSEKRIPRGTVTIRQVFNPEVIDGGKELVKEFKGCWPYFHCPFMSVERKDNNISLLFQEGSLGDIAVKLTLMNVQSESYEGEECTGLEYFIGGKINDVDIRMLEDGTFNVILNNNYIDYIPCEYSDCSNETIIEVEDISSFTEPSEETVVEHTNEGIIRCESIEVSHYNLFHKILKEKKIKYTQLFNEHSEDCSAAENLRKRWLQEFTKGIDITDIFIDSYLWHVFSYERLKAMQGEEAKERLKVIPKKNIYIFLNEGNFVYYLENAEKFLLEDIRFYQDVYVVDEDFTWTFVSTHEDGWFGPYFYIM